LNIEVQSGDTEAVIPHLVHGHEIGLGDFAAHEGAEFAVHRLPHRVVIREGEADAVDGSGRNQGREDQARQCEEFDAAGAELAQHVGVGAELVIRENLQIEAALGLRFDRRRHFPGADVHRVRFRPVVGIFVGEFGRLRARDMGRADATQDRRCGGCLE
jgi:hypothetical protein